MIIHNPIITGSLSLNGTTLSTGNIVTTGSNTFVGNQILTGSLNVTGSITATGNITAQTLVVQTITSSVVYSSGSNVFGNVIGNTHQFTGSVLVSGSMNVNANSLVVNTNGTVSIGNTNSTYNLDVTGTGRFSGNTYISGGDFGVGTTSPETYSGYRTAEISATAGGIVFAKSTTGSITTQLVADNGTSSGYVGTRTNHAFSIRTNNTDKVTISSTGAATFSSSVTAGAGTNITGYTNSSGANYLEIGSDTNGYYINAINRPTLLYNKPFYLDGQKIILNSGSGGNVGIGTSTPAYTLDVNNTTLGQIRMGTAAGAQPYWLIGRDNVTTGNFIIKDETSQKFTITNAGNVGIGTSSPFSQGSGATTMELAGNTYGQFFVSANSASIRGVVMARASTLNDVYIASITNSPLLFGTNDTERMRITSGGNVGIGTSSPVQPLQLGAVSVVAQDANSMYIGANFGTSTGGTYIKSQYANQIHFDSAIGNINFKIAGSGTAGNAISYTTAMSITSTGAISKYGGYVWEFFRVSKAFTENTTNVNFFSIQLGTNTSAVITLYLLSDNYGTGAFRQTTYQIGAGFYYGGYRSTTATLTDNRVGPGGDSSIGTVTVSSTGLITVALTTSTNGTGTTNDTSAYIVVNQNNGNAPTFTPL